MANLRNYGVLLLLLVAMLPVIGAEDMENGGYRISADIDYHIDGVTQEYILNNYMDFDEDRVFESRQALEEYLEVKEQEIINQRIFHTGRIEFEIQPRSEGPDLVLLDVYVKDTMNAVVLPYFKYDSNDGLLLSLRGRHYNFFGSMQPLAANLDYWYTENGEHEFSINSEFSMPFRLWQHEWVLDLSEDVVYTQSEPLVMKLGTDLGMYIPFWDVRWKLTYSQKYFLNDEADETEEDELAAEDLPKEDGFFFKSGLSFGGTIPTGLKIGEHELSYSPTISSSVFYKPGGNLSASRRGPSSEFKHSIAFGRVDWIKNYRSGYELSVSNTNEYNYYHADWDHSINTEFQGHLAGRWMGFSSRLLGFYMIDDQDDNAGDPIRGVLDSRIDDVEAGAYLNLDFPFPMWIWFMSRWFDAQVSPFFDAAYFKYGGAEEDWNPLWYGAGVEGFAYLKRSRSIYLRVSVGIDLQAMLEGGSLGAPAPRDNEPRYEIYIGLGHHY